MLNDERIKLGQYNKYHDEKKDFFIKSKQASANASGAFPWSV